jgi:uncharacterized protein (DUF885 family)
MERCKRACSLQSRVVVMVCWLAIASVVTAAIAAPPSASEQANALFAEYWEWQMRETPAYATYVGDHRYDDRMIDVSEGAIARRKVFVADLAKRLAQIDRNALSGQDVVSYAVLATKLDYQIRKSAVFADPAAAGADAWLSVTQFSGPQIGFAGLPSLVRVTRFESTSDYENYLKRLAAVPTVLEQTIANLKRAMARGWLPAEIVVARVPMQLDSLMPSDVTANPLYVPFTHVPADIGAADRDRLAAAGRAVLADKVVPAFRALKEFYETEYLPACRKGPGAEAQPGWPAYYAASVAELTTTSLTPREIHEMGLAEAARIGGEMDAVIARTGFKGTRAEFVAHIRSSPQFYYTAPEDMLAGYRDIAKRVDPELPRLFAELPRQPYGIRAMDAAEGNNAERYTGGTSDGSRAGYFEANVNFLSRRPKYDMETLFLHEAVPGHHLQSARAKELKELPMFRRFAFFPAFGEGWALYAESLGEDVGLYKDPYSKFGYLSSEMFRACRLVVDTGIHALGWSRERAISYLVDNAGIGEAFATAEVDRYYVWPGQALSYKVGELKIKALRAKAKAALGERFDIRRFHNALIDDGAVPLSVLEQRIDEWIARNKP